MSNLTGALKKAGKWSSGVLALCFAAAALDEGLLKAPPAYHALVSDSQKVEEQLWTISVNNIRVYDIPGIPDPVHNSINFRDPHGELITSIHGLAMDPKTAMPSLCILGEGNALRVFVTPVCTVPPDIRHMLVDETGVETEIFAGSFEEVSQKLKTCLDAASFINSKDNKYDTIEIFGVAQNSNSVCRTLVEDAMQLPFPKQNAAFWSPGLTRSLLPKNWDSVYNNQTETASTNIGPLVLNNFFQTLIQNYSPEDYTQKPFFDTRTEYTRPSSGSFFASIDVLAMVNRLSVPRQDGKPRSHIVNSDRLKQYLAQMSPSGMPEPTTPSVRTASLVVSPP